MAAEEVNHEILCAVIQEECPDWQALTAATLHNAPLRTIDGGSLRVAMPQEFADFSQRRAMA